MEGLMSQEENTEVSSDLSNPGEQTPENAPKPEGQGRSGGLPPAVIEEMQALRAENRQRSDELHALRLATLRSAAQGPQYDPIEVAMKKLEAVADPDAFKYVAPMMKPILQEVAAMRERNEQLEQQVVFLSRRDRERETHTQLATMIPDLNVIGPKLLEHIEKLPASAQQLYADNPQLFVPLAEAIRGSSLPGKKGNAAANRAIATMDTGSNDRGTPTTADVIANLDPRSKEFAALQRNFYGGDI
jgi:hypothetical protein